MSPLPADQLPPSSLLSSSVARLARSVLRLAARADSDDDAKCHPQPDIDLCEKPDSAKVTSEIVIGTLGGLLVVCTAITLVIFHLRNKRRDEREWPKDNQELDDYGIGSAPSAKSATTTTTAPGRPKNAYQKPRVDPDDGNDDHLPPPGPRRDSLQSLARSLRGNPDAYRSRPDDTSHDMKPVEPVSQL